jgi:hypothetical protein
MVKLTKEKVVLPDPVATFLEDAMSSFTKTSGLDLKILKVPRP